MQTQSFEIQHAHSSRAATDSVALFALEKRCGPLKRVYFAHLWAILLLPLPPPIPEQLHHVVFRTLDPLLQLVLDGRGDRVALQIFLEAPGRIPALKRVQDRQSAEDIQVWEDGGVVLLVIVFNIVASGGYTLFVCATFARLRKNTGFFDYAVLVWLHY